MMNLNKLVDDKILWAKSRLLNSSAVKLDGIVGEGEWAEFMKQHLEGFDVSARTDVEVELELLAKRVWSESKKNPEIISIYNRLQDFRYSI